MVRVSLYEAAVEVSEEFLGPAGKRFLDRQITTHLHIQPDKLQRKHLEELVDWVRLAFALLTNDKAQVEEYSDRMLDLAGTKTTIISPKLSGASRGKKL